MRSFKQCTASVAVLATGIVLMLAGTALAAFPNHTGCPTSTAGAFACIDIQNTSGNLNIKGFNVPLGPSLEIRGAISLPNEEGVVAFTPPAGTNGFFATPVAVPGGLLGIEWIPGTSVLATTELAGSPSNIHINTFQNSISIPVKVRLSNALLGMNCHIGTDSSPVVLNLITGTTSPPPPNRPISGRLGSLSGNETELIYSANGNVANEFAVPASSSCGLGLGLINALVNAKLQLPSAAGNNSIDVTNNIALRLI